MGRSFEYDDGVPCDGVPNVETRSSAADHEYVLKQAFLKHGLPRILYLDNGAAQRSKSLRYILAELGVRLLHTLPYDPQAKGPIERWNRTFRDEVESEFPGEPLPLQEAQSKVWSWLSVEYNAREHSTTKSIPREDWLAAASSRRSVPSDIDLDGVFLHRQQRRVRNDGTVRFRGDFLEVRSSLVGETVELRFDPFLENPLVEVFFDGVFVCDAVELDREANAYRKRHRPKGEDEPSTETTGINPLKLMQDEQIKRNTQPPKDEEDDDHDRV